MGHLKERLVSGRQSVTEVGVAGEAILLLNFEGTRQGKKLSIARVTPSRRIIVSC